MPSIKIPTPLRAYTKNQVQVDVQGETVASVLDDLVMQYPDLKAHLFEGERLRSFVNVFIADEDIRFLDGLETELRSDDKLRIIPSIAGGIDR